MRVLFHTPYLGYRTRGGAERQLTNLVKGLAGRGVDCFVATYRPGGYFWDELAETGRCRLHSLGKSRKGIGQLVLPWRLAAYARHIGADLIQGWLQVGSTFAGIAGALTGTPVVLGIRDTYQADAPWSRTLYIRLNGLLARWPARAVVSNSREGIDYHRGFGYPPDKLRLIPNGIAIPADALYPPPLADPARVTIVSLGRIEPFKDPPTMMRALAQVRAAGCPATLHVYGHVRDKDREYARAARDLAAELGVADHVVWEEPVPSPWPVLAGADIYLSTSVTEGMSNAVLEAMAAGRVVVATDAGDARAVLDGEDGRLGHVVARGDHRAVADAILRAVADPAGSRAMAAEAAQVARRRYALEAMVEAYHALYRRVLGGG